MARASSAASMRTSWIPLALLLAVGGVVWWSLRVGPAQTGPLPAAGTGGVLAPELLEPAALGPEVVAAPSATSLEAVPAELAGVEARWVELNNTAILRLGEGALGEALEMLERCHAAVPENEVFRGNLAEAFVRTARADHEARRMAEAIAALERALELDATRADVDVLRGLVERWKREVEVEENHWTEDSDLFELSYDTDREDILHRSQDVLDHLERAYDDLYRWFGKDPVRDGARGPIRVVLYRREEFGRLTGLGDWAGGAFDGVVRVSVEDLSAEEARWRRVLTHELVHVFVHALGGNGVPGWLNEGLAQFLESADSATLVARAERRLGTTWFPLERLQGSLATWQDVDEIGRAYAQSLLLVAGIAREYGDEAVRRMVLGCGRGEAPATTFEAYTSVPLSFLEELLARR